jgi:uncharacterized protein YbjT (DUF2867 family)
MTTSQKIIAVVGATGAQGGGLVRAILADPARQFAVRALTRKPDAPAAKELAGLGAEIVAADTDDAASLERAFAGAYGAFCLTNFWEHFSVDREQAQARNMAAAARAAGVRHVVWSTLEDTRRWIPLEDDRMPTLHGRFKVPHFDGKGEADAFFKEAGVPTTLLATSFYWENLIAFGMGPQRGPDGKLNLVLPMGTRKLPGIAAADIGKCAYGVFQRPELIGRTVGIAGDHPTGADMARELSKATGQEIGYQAIPFAAYRALGFPGADDLGNMFQFKHDFNEAYCGARDLAFARSLNPTLQNFAAWATANAKRIPIPAPKGA